MRTRDDPSPAAGDGARSRGVFAGAGMSSGRLSSYATAHGPPSPPRSPSERHSSSRQVPSGLVSTRTTGSVFDSSRSIGREARSWPNRRRRAASIHQRNDANVPSTAPRRSRGSSNANGSQFASANIPQLLALEKHLVLEPDRHRPHADVPVRRDAPEALLAHELGRDVEPAASQCTATKTGRASRPGRGARRGPRSCRRPRAARCGADGEPAGG